MERDGKIRPHKAIGHCRSLAALLPLSLSTPLSAEEAAGDSTVADLTARAKQSLVTVTHDGRDGGTEGIGSGFLLTEDGLVVTCFHVIGEARRINIALADGSRHEVTEIYAHDRSRDLAILRTTATGRKVLDLGDSDAIRQGERVIAMGNPAGFEFSVVDGVVSAIRDFDSGPMIQVAMPIEMGNSGGPVLDEKGLVKGVISLKSVSAENIGFAIPSNAVGDLLANPSPIAIDDWLTIGALDPRWQQVMGARWRQRAGSIIAESPGSGFGGRSLCLWQEPPPEVPYEVAVTVRLDDEAGAAGLAFASDGGDVHYGFYPSGGRVRLTRFEGADVFSWTIVEQFETAAYRPGDWNRLRVRVEADRIIGYVNGEKVMDSPDRGIRGGKAGLAKFRDTVAEFKRFSVGKDLAIAPPPPGLIAALETVVDAALESGLPPSPEQTTLLKENARVAQDVFERRARALEESAAHLRDVAEAAHVDSVVSAIVSNVEPQNTSGGLAEAALSLSRLDNPDIDVPFYLDRIGSIASHVRAEAEDSPSEDPLSALHSIFFEKERFHGSRINYYDRSNSYLNEAIDDREGLPITLSLLFLEVAREAGVVGLEGVGLPGHFVVRSNPDGIIGSDDDRYIDVFDDGSFLTVEEADAIAGSGTSPLRPASSFPEATPRDIVVRMLHNLKGVAEHEEDWRAVWRYAEALAALQPDSAQDRLARAVSNLQQGWPARARRDFEWILEKEPPGIDLDRVRRFLDDGL